MFELGTQFSWVTIDLSLLFLQSSSRSTGLSSSLEASLTLFRAKPEAWPWNAAEGPSDHLQLRKKRKPNKLSFSLHCCAAFWRDRSTACAALPASALLPLHCFPREAAWQQLWFSCWESHLLKAACSKAASKSDVFSYCKLLLAGSNSPAVASIAWLDLLFWEMPEFGGRYS